MKKYLIVFLLLLLFTNCEKVGNKGMSGIWHTDPEMCHGIHTKMFYVYEFINHNTCHFCLGIMDDYSHLRGGASNACKHHSGWYHCNASCQTLTYYVLDNKIYIADGAILTIVDDNTLIVDGNGDELHKTTILR